MLIFFFLIGVLQVSSQNTKEELWSIWQNESENDSIRIKSFHNYIYKYFVKKHPDSALILIQNEIKFAEDKGLKRHLGSAYLNTAKCYTAKDEYQKSIEYYELAFDIWSQIKYKKGEAAALNNLGTVYYKLGKYRRSTSYLLQSIAILEQLQNYNMVKTGYQNLGLYNYRIDNYDDALVYFLKSLEIEESEHDLKAIEVSYNRIGTVYKSKGDYYKALNYYEKALRICDSLNLEKSKSTVFNNMSIVYESQGDSKLALEYLEKSLNISEEIGENSKINGTAYGNLGHIYANQNNYEKALFYNNKALLIHEALDYKSGMANINYNLGKLFYQQGKYEESAECLNKSLEIRKFNADKKGILRCLIRQGKLALKQNNPSLALQKFQESLTISKNIQAEISKIQPHQELYQWYFREEDYTSAEEHIVEVLDLRMKSLKMNFVVLSEREKEMYFNTMKDDYDMFYQFASIYQNEKPSITELAYNNALFSKGLLLKSSTALRQSIMNSSDSTISLLYEDWLELKKNITINYSKGESTIELEKEANQLEKELIIKSPIFQNFDQILNIDWKYVQKNLNEGEAAIEFVNYRGLNQAEDQYAALIITKNSKYPEMIELFKESELTDILGVFKGNNHNYINSVYGKKGAENSKLYQLIWKPLEPSLKNIKSIHLSPSGLLHKISFSALSKEKTILLCDSYRLHLNSSTSNLINSKEYLFNKMDHVTVFGGPDYNYMDNNLTTGREVWKYLPGTLIESQQIADFINSKNLNASLYTGVDASEAQFKEVANSSTILHIATHGFFFPDPQKVQEEFIEEAVDTIVFRGVRYEERGTYGNWSFINNQNPLMRSGLALSGANSVWTSKNLDGEEDGVLTAQEVAVLDLNATALVVLSACETGLGDIRGYEGVYGLQRSFKIAGVDKIIMSLWQVPDKETSEFMTLFYKNWLQFKQIDQAFLATQATFRKKYDAYFWAAFVLVE